jgi:tetratricopeptide (TPR) repeat protein
MKHKTLTYVLLIILLNFYSHSFSQNTTLDSLNSHVKQDTIRVNLLNKIAFNTLNKNPNESIKYSEESRLLANKIRYIKGEAKSLFLSGNAQIKLSNFEKSRDYLQEALILYKSINDDEGLAKCFTNFGTSYFYQGDYTLAQEYYEKALVLNKESNSKARYSVSLNHVGMMHSIKGDFYKAIESYNESLEIEETLNNQYQIAKVLNNMGILYYKRSDYPKAIELYTRAVMIHEKLGNNIQASTGLYNIGLTYRLYKNYEKALEYYNKSLKIEQEYGGQRNIALCLMGIGTVYTKQGKQEKALEFLKKALTLFIDIKDSTHISSCSHNLGDVFLNNGQYGLALEHYSNALKINKVKGPPSSTCHSYIKIAAIHYKRKEYKKALDNAFNSQIIANKHEFLEYKKDVSELLSNIYSDTKNYKKAYESHLEYKTLNDSIFNKKNIEKIAQLESEHKYRERLLSAKERETSLKEEVKTIDEELTTSKQEKLWAIIGSLCLIMILSFVIFFLRIKSLKTTSENILTEQKLLRSQMTPHFIFNSLSVLQGIILSKEDIKSIKYLSGFSKLLRLTLENSRDKVVLLKNELQAIEHYLNLQNMGTETPYNYTITVDKNINLNTILIPPMLIQPFIENAIEHGFKHKKDDRQIHITITFDNTNLMCSIIDNGIGIDKYKKEGFTQKKSLSTTITSERLKMFSKEFNLQTNLSIKDRNTTNEEGTIVVLTLPYKNNQDD